MSGKLLIIMKIGKILCHLLPLDPLCAMVVAREWRESDSSIFVDFSFFPSLCAPVLVFVMGKEAVHGGTLNKKAYLMAEYLKKAGY